MARLLLAGCFIPLVASLAFAQSSAGSADGGPVVASPQAQTVQTLPGMAPPQAASPAQDAPQAAASDEEQQPPPAAVVRKAKKAKPKHKRAAAAKAKRQPAKTIVSAPPPAASAAKSVAGDADLPKVPLTPFAPQIP